MAIDFQPDIDFKPDPQSGSGAIAFTPDAQGVDFQPDDVPTLRAQPDEGWLHKAAREVRESLSPLIGPTDNQRLRDSVDGQYKPLGDRVDQEGFLPAVTSPTLPSPTDGLTPDEIANMPVGYKIASGAAQAAENLGAGIVFTGGAAMEAAPAVANRAIQAYFATEMAKAAGTQAGNVSVNPDARTITQAAIEIPASAAFAVMSGTHAVRGPYGDLIPGRKSAGSESDAPARVANSEFAEPVDFQPDPAPAAPEPLPLAPNSDAGPAPQPVAVDNTGPVLTPVPAPATQTDVAGVPVQRIDAGDIATRPDLMQFKRMDDTDSGVNQNDKLGGQWDDLKAGNLLLWQPENVADYGLQGDQKYIVANGHHRFEFGQAQDVPEYNAQIVKQSEGYSAQDARGVAAEANIADGKGTIYDQVKFLRNESDAHGPDAALARAGSIGVKGRQAATIAFEATPDLHTSFINERISPGQAEAIAAAAPSTSDARAGALQRLGIRKAVDGAGPQELRNTIQAVRVESSHVAPDQMDLFAADDSAISTAEHLGKVAGRIQDALSTEIRSTESAAKNASTARAKGVKFDVPPEEILAANAKLKGERARWDNWALHPDLISQVREYARMDRSQGGKKSKPVQPTIEPAALPAPAPAPAPDATPPAPAPAGLVDKLQSMKLQQGGELFSSLIPGVDPATFRAVWNTGLDVAIAAVKAGKAIGEAIQSAVDHIRSKFPQGDEATLRVAMARQLGDTRQFGEKVLADPNISPDVRSGVNNYNYTPRSNETDLQSAQRIISDRGVDNAIAAFKDQRNWDGNGAVQSALGKALIKNLADAERMARTTGDTLGSRELVGKQVDLIDHELRRSTDIAQALQAMSLYSRMSPGGLIAHAQRTIEAAGDSVLQRAKPALENVKTILQQSNAAAVDDFKHDPEINRVVKTAVDKTVLNSPEVHKAVVMELGPEWSKSPAIVAHARELVRSRANDLLKAQSDSAVPASKRLKVILDDLSSRAASIAAAHFQGAEPNIPLTDKFVQRLGLSKEKAGQLAKGMESTWKEQVARAKAQLPKSLARARAKADQPYNPQDLSDTAVDKEIRRQLADTQLNIGKVLHSSFGQVDATGKGLADRVVSGIGLEGDPVQLRAVFQRRWDALVNARKQAALKQLLAGGGDRGNATVKKIWQRVVDVSNLGAFSDKKYYDAVREKLNLPTWSSETAAEITRRANSLQEQPEGFQRDRTTVDLLDYIENRKGVKMMDLPMALWYGNVLSGVTTPVHVLVDNIGSIAGNVAAVALHDQLAFPGVVKSLGRGLEKGLVDAASILKTGKVTGLRADLYTSPILERNPFKGPASFLNAYKYVGRLLSATHVSTFKPAWEMKSYLAARDAAKGEGLTGQALSQRVSNILANSDERVMAASTQAAAEGLSGLDARKRTAEIIEQQREQNLPGLTDQAREFALRATYLNKPYGAIGWASEKFVEGLNKASQSNPVLAHVPRLIVPFTRIVSNILNEKLNYTPVGAFRAWKANESGRLYGQELQDPRLKTEQGELYAKSIMGTLAVSGLAALAARYIHDDDPRFAVTGGGPSTPEARKQLMATGWRPNSLKIGSQYYSYARTPVGYALAVAGNYMDAVRYRKVDQLDLPNRLALAAKGMPQIIVQQSFLEGIGNLLDTLGNENTKHGADQFERWLAKQGASFAVPNALRQADRFFDPTVYDGVGVKGMLAAQVPFLRREGRPSINALGQPVQSGVFSYDSSPETTDPVWRMLAAKQAWLSAVPPEVIVGDKKRGPDYYRALTDPEKYSYTRQSGQLIHDRLADSLTDLDGMDPIDARKAVQKIAGTARKETLKDYR